MIDYSLQVQFLFDDDDITPSVVSSGVNCYDDAAYVALIGGYTLCDNPLGDVEKRRCFLLSNWYLFFGLSYLLELVTTIYIYIYITP